MSAEDAAWLAVLVKALADPTRLRIVDAVRSASPQAVCQCELLPLFDISQAALAKHLKVLLAAGLLGVERRGLWAYYFLAGEPLWEHLRAWLAPSWKVAGDGDVEDADGRGAVAENANVESIGV
jgi:ArsR family transcriptional regulator, arsenate/arsenite/antimonite-responsive transcriptional repressor